ncbi:MAG: prenyltransferase, partial [Anaerolineae bacterium]
TAGVSIDWGRYALGQVIVTAIQVMTHYANEYFDAEADRANGANRTWFSGGSGVLPDGRLAPRIALRAARISAGVAIAAIGIALPIEPAVSLVGGLALLGGWFYSAPPVRLVASGFGELATALMVSLLVPLTAVLMQRSPIGAPLLAVALPLALINLAMQLAFEFPDFDADRATGKRTLTVRLGRDRAVHLHNVLLASAFAVAWIASASGWIDPHVAAWMLLTAPLAVWQVAGVLWRARRGWRGYGLMTAGGVGLFALATATFLAGFVRQ